MPKPPAEFFSVGDHQIDGMVFDQAGQAIFDDVASRTSKNVADEREFA